MLYALVPRRRRFKLCVKSCCSMLESVELRRWVGSATANVDWARSLLQGHGFQLEEPLQYVGPHTQRGTSWYADQTTTAILMKFRKTLVSILPKSRRSNICTILTGDLPPSESGLGLRYFRHVQGPTWGYPTEGAYYRDASSSDSLFAVRIPLFAIHAKDDPVYSQRILWFSFP